ncbi:MAG TPA: O-antigen ligase family protein [Dissulfurispiraceae bacterium]|nr:O-antigen ligase family protein [Dissulfurispiraceae bacterium]
MATPLIFPIFVFLLVFSPLAFGTVEPWSWAVVKSLAFLAFVLLLIRKRKDEEPFLYEVPGLVPLSLFLGYILLQLVPMPPFILKVVSPGAYDLYRETLWAADPHAWGSVSVNMKATVSEFFKTAALAAFYVVTIHMLARKDRLKKTVRIVVVFASVLALFSMLQYVLWNNKIYWLRELTAGGKPFGPYVNRNHYAGFADMVLPLIICLFIYYRPRYSCRSLRERVVEVFSSPLTNVHILLGTAALLVAVSVFMSLSKGGIISLCMSLIFLAAAVRNRARGGVLVALLVTVLFYSVGSFGWDRIFNRFEALRDAQGNIAEARLGIWDDSLGAIRDFPLTGTGLGTFAHIFPRYKSRASEWLVDHAHNDYLELLCDGGLISFLIVACFLAAVLRTSYRSFLERRGRYSIIVFIGAVTGIVSVLIHSVTDFNLRIGANALYFVFLAGLAVSAAHTRLREGRADTLLRRKLPVTKGLIVAASSVLMLSVIFDAGDTSARLGLSSLKAESVNAQTARVKLEERRTVAHRASFWDPFSAEGPREAARAEWLLSERERALEEYRKAVRRDPVDGGNLQALGLALSALGRDGEAGSLLRSGIACDRSNPLRYRTYASWLISSGKREQGADYIRKAIALEPDKTRDYVALLVLNGWSDSEIRTTLPDMVRPHVIFADYLHQTGNNVMADSVFRAAVEHVRDEKTVNPSDYHKAGRYFMKRGLYDDALAVMRKAEEVLPTDVGIKIALGEIYEKAGIPYRAAEQYRKALMIDPRESRARGRLVQLQHTDAVVVK